MSDESGAELGKYRLLAKLGEGGMGAVYLAEHVMMGKRVALKLIRAEVAASPELTSRFINEARAAARVPHPGIVQMFDCGLDAQGRAYLAMELLRGESLGTFLRRHGALAEHPALIRRLARDVALAVGAAHAAGIVHRDLKPDNLFLAAHHEGPGLVELKVLDFGVAKLAAAITGPDARSTQSGALIGTVVYMSPEQCLGAKTIDARSDVYSLGCIVYEMASGRTPFGAVGVGGAIAAHLTEAPRRLRELVPAVDEALDALVMRMLAKDPGDRPPDMTAVAAALTVGLPAEARGGPLALPAGFSVPSGEPGPPALRVPTTVDILPTLLRATAPSPVGAATAANEPGPVDSKSPTTLSSFASAMAAGRKKAAGRRRAGPVLALTALGAAGAALAIVRPGPLGRAIAPATSKPSETASRRDDMVTLEVTGVPPGGRASLDGKPIVPPVRLARDGDDHELRVEAAGFEAFVHHIRAHRDLHVAVALKPLPPPTANRAHGDEASAAPRRGAAKRAAAPARGDGDKARERTDRAKDLIQDI